MSILITELLSKGIVFGADRNLTESNSSGMSHQKRQVTKVIKWPNDKTLFGFVGVAEIEGMLLPDWLKTIETALEDEFGIEAIAHYLHERIQRSWTHSLPAEGLIIHLGGFTKIDEIVLPSVWHIANVEKHGEYGYTEFSNDFFCQEAFLREFKHLHPIEIRKKLRVLEKNLQPFWFHQGFDYPAFNAMQEALKSSFRYLCLNHPSFDFPESLSDWEKHVNLQVLLYSAYFESFHPVGKRYVGGGTDVVSIRWPD